MAESTKKYRVTRKGISTGEGKKQFKIGHEFDLTEAKSIGFINKVELLPGQKPWPKKKDSK